MTIEVMFPVGPPDATVLEAPPVPCGLPDMIVTTAVPVSDGPPEMTVPDSPPVPVGPPEATTPEAKPVPKVLTITVCDVLGAALPEPAPLAAPLAAPELLMTVCVEKTEVDGGPPLSTSLDAPPVE